MTRAEQLASLGTLSATIAHQVTQPLTVIRLSLDNVVDELEETSCSSRVLRRLRDSVAQVSSITSIINQFRNFARQSSDTSLGQVDVYSVALRVARLLEESAKRARVTLHVEDMSELPPVFLHEREFEQILFALVENAIQAADGKKIRRIVISGYVKDEHIELRFSDTCGGIPPESLDKIFEPFFTTKPRGQGTGLGLCIVRDAVARVGGRVRIESEFGKGSDFFVTLPISEE
jgi:C4-dicarboxylate-specific signal transduction histidine kinase